MELHQVLIKNFQDYLDGKEVEATAKLKENKVLQPGDHVLVFKDSLAATSTLSVPRSKQDLSIGIEGTVTQVDMRDPVKKEGSGILKIKVKKL